MDRAAVVGHRAAAAESGISATYLFNLLQRHRPGVIRPRTIFSEEKIAAALTLAKEVGFPEAARRMEINVTSLRNIWRARVPRDQVRKIKRTTLEFRKAALARVKQIGIRATAKELDVSESSLQLWVRKDAELSGKHTVYPEGLREKAIELRKQGIGPLKISLQLNVPQNTASMWTRGIVKQVDAEFTDEFLSQVREFAFHNGRKRTAEHFNLEWNIAKRLTRNLQLEKRTGRGQKGFDAELIWMKRGYPAMEKWRLLAVAWIAEQDLTIPSKLNALARFFDHYLSKLTEAHDPSIYLSIDHEFPDFFATQCRMTGYDLTLIKHIHDFLNWVLIRQFSEKIGGNRRQFRIGFHNPVKIISRSGLPHPSETVYSPLPYGYLEELREILAPGPNFCDWSFAQGALDYEMAGETSLAFGWFEVSLEKIDKSDPDCVWRERIVSGRVTLEMWSPVRWVALLVKLILPLRNYQVQVLDSGEADTWRYGFENGIPGWKLNTHSLAQGSPGRPVRQGVFRKQENDLSTNKLGEDSVLLPKAVLYINTNKTADVGKAGSEKGFEMPWIMDRKIHSNVFYWLEKLRNWQEKYNPISRLTSWSELDARHTLKKSEVRLAGYPDTAFLFRAPEQMDSNPNLPLTMGRMDAPWRALLRVFESRLAERGETHPDGEPIRLVRKNGSRTPEFALHGLRVSLITSLVLDGGISFPIIQKLVGHGRILMSIYYTKVGSSQIHEALIGAFENMEKSKEGAIFRFLRTTEYDQLLKEVLCGENTSLGTVLAEHPAVRNPAGWMPLHIGLCPVGGNINLINGDRSRSGCFNGGPNTGTPSTPVHGPVPGGARNCVRCRWFLTHPFYLQALVAHFNTIMYYFNEAKDAWAEVQAELDSLKEKRFNAERAGEEFDETKMIADLERRSQTLTQSFIDRAEDGAACEKLIERCRRALNNSKNEGENALLAVGALQDVKIIIEQTSSELLQLTTVCEGAEFYPDLNPGKAVFRRSQILDAALTRDSKPAIFMVMNEREQLLCGNYFIKTLAKRCNHELALGRRQIVELIESGGSLKKHLGIDVYDEFDKGMDDVTVKALEM